MMQRREFITGAAGSGMAAGAQRRRAPAAASKAQARRNILLVYVEQFQHNTASFAGGPAKTPNLEKLAAESIHFRTACTTTGLCSPARSALFTGRLGHRTGLDDNCYVWHSRLTGLDLRHTTLIEWARRKDYFIGYYGKWHLGVDGPIRRGAHRFPYTGMERQRNPGKTSKPDFAAMQRYYDKSKNFPEKPGYFSTAEGTYESSQPANLARGGAAFLDEAGKTGLPFFLTVSFINVHPPYNVPKPYNTMYDPRSVELPSNLRDTFKNKPQYQNDVMWPFHDTGHFSEDDWRRSIAYYHGDMTMLDRAIGEVFDALKRNGQWENTLTIFIADHGDMNGAHNRFDKGPYCYDEIVRIPLLVHAPGTAPREVTRHVHSMDINQTIVEWAGLEPDTPNVDSRSLFPLMERGDAGWNTPDEAFYRYEWYNGLWFGIRSIRTPGFKYCFNPGGVDELYDLRKDPGEMNNLIDQPDTLAVQRDLEARLLAYLKKTEDTLVHDNLRLHLEANPHRA